MRITWLGHACFALESGGYRLVIDPYRDVPGYGALQTSAHAVFCSHGHFDHAATECVTLLPPRPSPFAVKALPCFHDEVRGAKRGENTIHLFESEGLRVAHLGDLGHPLSSELLAALRECDVLLLPVGGVYTIDPAAAKQVAEAVNATVTVPMHCRRGALGFETLAEVEDFLSLYPPQRVRRLDCAAFDPAALPAGTVLLPAFGE